MLNVRSSPLVMIFLLTICLTGCGKNKSLVSDAAITSEPTGSVVEQMLLASGLDQFNQVTQMQFTFNVRKPNHTIQRKWIWHPKQDKVTLIYTDDSDKEQILSYIRRDVASNTNAKQSLKTADRWFINDSFWLIMPLHLAWQNQQDIQVVDQGIANYPLGDGAGRHITVTFKDATSGGGGYTPGDRYELFLGDKNLIAQWVYHKGGDDKPALTSTFEKYTSFGSYNLALDHRNPDGFKLWFTDVKIVTE